MLLSEETAALAKEFTEEAKHRLEFMEVPSPDLAGDDNFWQIVFDLMENTIHRMGYAIIKRSEYVGVDRRKKPSVGLVAVFHHRWAADGSMKDLHFARHSLHSSTDIGKFVAMLGI